MPLKGPNPEDTRKLHAEINQIVNQRFLLTTLAITVFGVMAAWLIPKTTPSPKSDVGLFTIAGSTLLTFLLGALYLFNHFFLKGMLRLYTSYLLVTESSGWESDWETYRNNFKGYLGYTKGQAFVFLLLGVISTVFPFLIALGYSLSLYPCDWLYIHVAVGVIYFLFVLFTGIFGRLDPEKKATERWKKLKNDI